MSTILKFSLTATFFILAALGVNHLYVRSPSIVTLHSGTALPHPKALPDFKLTDAHEHVFSQKQLQGEWSFIFFGYSQCAGICPATLGKLTEIAHLLPQSAPCQFVFVSIDPKQDTPSHLKAYFSQPQFKGANFLGVTGNLKDIQALASTIGLFVSEDNIPVNGHIEHSGTVLLVNPDGKLAAVFSNPNSPSGIVKDVKTLMHQYHQGLS